VGSVSRLGVNQLSARVAAFLRHHVGRANEDATRVDVGAQLVLAAGYRELRRRGEPLPSFGDVAFRSYSQNQEDGILLYLFALVGATNRIAVEICAGDGIECNTANLVLNHGWTALLVDGDEARVARGREFYSRRRETRVWPPTFVHRWVTAENVNDLLREHEIHGAIDLLSLDLDGVDWWIWRAIDVIEPRVVIVEYQDIWGPERAVTVPYDAGFHAEFRDRAPDYAGASLAAFVKLGQQKGYGLVGCEPLGFNAFFVRDGVGDDLLPEIDPALCFGHPKVAWGQRVRLPRVAHLEWVEV
jgi:hypothetical protein